MLETLKNAWKVTDLRKKILYTLGIPGQIIILLWSKIKYPNQSTHRIPKRKKQ